MILRDDAALDQLRAALGRQLLSSRRCAASRVSCASACASSASSRVRFASRLRERRLERPPIDREEQLIACLDEVAFVERHLGEQCR